jgi:type IV pilus assembly protein PilW
MKTNTRHLSQARRGQRGFTLLELMIAVLIAMFLIFGLVTLVGAMKISFSNQSGMSQLQENERMAMTLITDVIQSTGYFPNPLINTAVSSFPIVGSFTYAGQALVGTGNYTDPAPGNSITVRYATSGTDNVINCMGNTSIGAATFINTFSIDANGNLNCTLIVNSGQPVTVPLISNLNSLQIYYGVQTNTGVSNNSVDSYLDAATVTANNYWKKVISVKITMTFVNPMFGQAGQTAAALKYISFTRVIDVMNKTGVIT